MTERPQVGVQGKGGADAVSSSHELMTYGTSCERLPRFHRHPHEIGQLFSHRINPQIIERDFAIAVC